MAYESILCLFLHVIFVLLHILHRVEKLFILVKLIEGYEIIDVIQSGGVVLLFQYDFILSVKWEGWNSSDT